MGGPAHRDAGRPRPGYGRSSIRDGLTVAVGASQEGNSFATAPPMDRSPGSSESSSARGSLGRTRVGSHRDPNGRVQAHVSLSEVLPDEDGASLRGGGASEQGLRPPLRAREQVLGSAQESREAEPRDHRKVETGGRERVPIGAMRTWPSRFRPFRKTGKESRRSQARDTAGHGIPGSGSHSKGHPALSPSPIRNPSHHGSATFREHAWTGSVDDDGPPVRSGARPAALRALITGLPPRIKTRRWDSPPACKLSPPLPPV